MKQSGSYKVKITLGDAVIEVDGAESGVVRIVEALARVFPSTKEAFPKAGELPVPTRSIPHATAPQVDIRTFFAQKTPSSDVEAATLAAYFYKYVAPENQRRDTIDATSLAEAFRLARRPQPKRAIWTLQNARNAGYLDSAGDGQYRLNTVGYNLVEFTLGASAESRQETPRKRPKKRPPKKTVEGGKV